MIIRYSWPSAYEKPLSLMFEGVERLFQVFVVEFEVGEFELERVVAKLHIPYIFCWLGGEYILSVSKNRKCVT